MQQTLTLNEILNKSQIHKVQRLQFGIQDKDLDN